LFDGLSTSIRFFSLTSFGVFAAFLYNTTDSCETANQNSDLLPVPPLDVPAAFSISSSEVLIRYIENLQYLAIHMRDKETGEFMSDEYFVWRILMETHPTTGQVIWAIFSDSLHRLDTLAKFMKSMDFLKLELNSPCNLKSQSSLR
jgi:hypothetical protein